MHLIQSNPFSLDTFGLDDPNLTQSNSNLWIQTGLIILQAQVNMLIFRETKHPC